MAEFILKIGVGSGYTDGDILTAFNNDRVSCEHASLIALERNPSTRKFITYNDTTGLVDSDSLTEDLCSLTCEFKFERLNRTQLKIIQLSDLQEITILSNSPFFNPFSNKTEGMDVEKFVSRRLATLRKDDASGIPIFGSEGQEVWYGGTKNMSKSVIDTLWDRVESKTPKLRTDVAYKFWPMGNQDKKSFLGIQTADFTKVQAEDFIAPEMLGDVVVKKRKNAIDWKTIGISGASIANIEDKSITVDNRDKSTFDLTIVRTKT